MGLIILVRNEFYSPILNIFDLTNKCHALKYYWWVDNNNNVLSTCHKIKTKMAVIDSCQLTQEELAHVLNHSILFDKMHTQ